MSFLQFTCACNKDQLISTFGAVGLFAQQILYKVVTSRPSLGRCTREIVCVAKRPERGVMRTHGKHPLGA